MSPYPYLDVADLHFQFGQNVPVVRQQATPPQLVTAVLILVVSRRVHVTFTQLFLIVRLKQREETFIRNAETFVLFAPFIGLYLHC